jgi:hypothetical protein
LFENFIRKGENAEKMVKKLLIFWADACSMGVELREQLKKISEPIELVSGLPMDGFESVKHFVETSSLGATNIALAGLCDEKTEKEVKALKKKYPALRFFKITVTLSEIL